MASIKFRKGFSYSLNVQAQGRCAALSRSAPWSAVLALQVTRGVKQSVKGKNLNSSLPTR